MNFKSLIPAVALLLPVMVDASVATREISDGWRFRQGSSQNWYPAEVPGTVHTDLMANGIIEDPFFRLNERGVQWVDKEDWMYETTFDATAAETGAENQELVFYGLDTYADVYLNHLKVVSADNMHRTWRCDVKGMLKEGENLLEVYFHSPIKVDLPKFDKYDYAFNTGPDQSQRGGIFNKTLSVFARKAGYHYGWDWGPRLVTSGIWRPIELQTWSGLRIDDVQYIQKDVNASKASLRTVVEIRSDEDISGVDVNVTADGRTVASKSVNLKKGLNRVAMDYDVKKPRLWWSNGLGEPDLTEFTASVSVGGKVEGEQSDMIGLRSLKMIHKPDKDGHALYFELNGKPVFAKGVDMVPLDNFLPRITKEKYEKHVLDAKAVNMNMIRVWGGGVYEDDYFYDLCDRNGILVWQDFMFACSTYPADSVFLDNVRKEAIDNVKRLRNHCSIALWCGNNECQDVYYGWGGKHKYYQEKGVETLTTKQFKDHYFKTLPDVVEEYGGGISYRPSSPFAFEDTPSDGINGDAHYWGVWHGRDSIGHYNVERARFFSEYGFQSFPEFESVKIYAPEERDWDINSEVMMDHQRAGSYANNLIREYMEEEFRKPEDFPTFLYVGSVLQGDAIKTAIEAHRRDMPYCMGTLVWQHNDCWPVASWAGRDWYGRWKAQQYYSKAAYDDILVSPVVLGDTLVVNLVSDRRQPVKGKFTLKVMKLDGTPVNVRAFNHKLDALSSDRIMKLPLKELLGDNKRGEVIIHAEYDIPGDRSYDNVAFATKQKFMDYQVPEYNLTIVPAEGGYDVTVGSDTFARAVFLSLEGIDNFFSDNYFNILPGRRRTIRVTSTLPEDEFRRQLKIISMGDVHAAVAATASGSMQRSDSFRPLGE
ncbi:MAG: glycoside hydrolase family 2 protein [Muribaculaceae bacterium]|nr:glycoside hydrolase family 2 protein [Muribaculaceae bacterium]